MEVTSTTIQPTACHMSLRDKRRRGFRMVPAMVKTPTYTSKRNTSARVKLGELMNRESVVNNTLRLNVKCGSHNTVYELAEIYTRHNVPAVQITIQCNLLIPKTGAYTLIFPDIYFRLSSSVWEPQRMTQQSVSSDFKREM